jgi:hypothetical protein
MEGLLSAAFQTAMHIYSALNKCNHEKRVDYSHIIHDGHASPWLDPHYDL